MYEAVRRQFLSVRAKVSFSSAWQPEPPVVHLMRLAQPDHDGLRNSGSSVIWLFSGLQKNFLLVAVLRPLDSVLVLEHHKHGWGILRYVIHRSNCTQHSISTRTNCRGSFRSMYEDTCEAGALSRAGAAIEITPLLPIGDRLCP